MPINHIGRYSDPDAPVVVIDATTGQRWPIWVEIDSNAGSAANTALEIHPAVNFASGHRYIVALRNLKDAGGQTIPAPEGFRYYRDQLASSEGPINAQRARFESIFNTLRGAGSGARTSTSPGTSRSPPTRTSPRASSTSGMTPWRASATRPPATA